MSYIILRFEDVRHRELVGRGPLSISAYGGSLKAAKAEIQG